MKIYVVSSIGKGTTLLSAFDNALHNAGVHNYNLIFLSSIIPPASKVIKTRRYKTSPNEFGHKLYVVESEIRSAEIGAFLAAGLGWYQLEDTRGYFVEHKIKGETRLAVKSEIKSLITRSLQDMCKFRKVKFSKKKLKMSISIGQVISSPTSVMTLAVYRSEGWK